MKLFNRILFIFTIFIMNNFTINAYAKVGCVGSFVNPITDVCWDCLFPIKIAGIEVVKGDFDPGSPNKFLCVCARPGIPIPVPGIPIGFWEPARLVDVTKSPMCMVNLGGVSLGSSHLKGVKEDGEGTLYHVHWYIYPVLYWLELLLDFICLDTAAFDIAYMTEYDPLWADDSKSAILNPEALLFGNPIAVGSCIVDCLTSSVGLSNDLMFWCSGCQGCLYPMSGNTSYHNGGVNSALLIVSKFIAKGHRSLMLWGYYGNQGMCGRYPMPIIKKSQYRVQMTYPIPETKSCKRIGQSAVLWQGGKEYPIRGEDFGFLIWRKRDCCLF